MPARWPPRWDRTRWPPRADLCLPDGRPGSVVSLAAGAPAASAAAVHPATSQACTGPFTLLPAPDPGKTDNIILATAAAGPDAEWAVGRQSITGGYANQIVFNGGSGWSEVSVPGPTSTDSELGAVSASSPTDAWAAGYYVTSGPNGVDRAEALHWNGTAWTLVTLPALPGQYDFDEDPGLVDISPTDAWLSGGWFNSAKQTSGSFIAHWNGTAWSLVSHPAAVSFVSMADSGPDDVWALGVGTGGSFPSVIEHYNGSAWTTSTIPAGVTLGAITAISATDAWAVGSSGGGTATINWNGTAWTVVPSPSTGALSGVSGLAGGDVWAIGSLSDFSTGVGEPEPMAMYWNGTSWITVASGDTQDGSAFSGVDAVTPSDVNIVGWETGQAQSLLANVCPITVSDTGFGQSSASFAGAGTSAYWEFPASNPSDQELVDGTGLGLFDSGAQAPGSSYAFRFPAAGVWTVTEKTDNATEEITIPMRSFTRTPGYPPALWWAVSAPPSGAYYEIEDIPPGGTRFVHFDTTTKTFLALPKKTTAPGVYKFRSRMYDTALGATTGWSPVLTVTVT
jgi:hypothetical protein